jgi:HlyD family secretion protein
MKRPTGVLFIVLALVAVGGAGYLGTRSAQGSSPSAFDPPTTVEVTQGDVQQTVTAPGQMVGIRQATLALDVGGRLTQVNVQPGRRVQIGDVLARLNLTPFEAGVVSAWADLRVAQAQLEQLLAGPSEADIIAAQLALAQAEAQLHHLQAGPSVAEIAAAKADVAAALKELDHLQSLPDPAAVAQARAELDSAAAALQQAQAIYDQVRYRPDVGMMPQALHLQQATITYEAAKARFDAANRPPTPVELEAAQARLVSAQANLAHLHAGSGEAERRVAEMQKANAEAHLKRLTDGPSTADLEQARAAVLSAEQFLKRAEADLAAATLTAPFDGTILEVNANPGEMVAGGAGLIRLMDTAAMEIEVSVIEEDLPLVQVGQRVELFFDAQPDATAQGRVARIVPQRLPGDRSLYPVYITADNLPANLLAGMTVDASIVIASRHGTLRLPRAVVRARADGTAAIQVWTGSHAQERLVKVGLRGDTYVEILDGLQTGERVVTE